MTTLNKPSRSLDKKSIPVCRVYRCCIFWYNIDNKIYNLLGKASPMRKHVVWDTFAFCGRGPLTWLTDAISWHAIGESFVIHPKAQPSSQIIINVRRKPKEAISWPWWCNSPQWITLVKWRANEGGLAWLLEKLEKLAADCLVEYGCWKCFWWYSCWNSLASNPLHWYKQQHQQEKEQ